MSGDENKLKKYRFPETLTNQSRWFGLPLDELIPAAICIGWGITTSKYLFGIGAAVLVYFGIKKLKKGGAVPGYGPDLLVYANSPAARYFS